MTGVATPPQPRTRMSKIGGSGLSTPFHNLHCPCILRTWISALQSVGGWFFCGDDGFLRLLKTAHQDMRNVDDFLGTLCVRNNLRLISMSWPSVTSILKVPPFSSNSSLKLFSISTFSAIVFTLLRGNDVVSQSPRTWLARMHSNFKSSDITVALLHRTVASQFSNWTSASTLAFQDQRIKKGTHQCIHVEYRNPMSPFSDSMENMACQHDVNVVMPHHAVLTTDGLHFLTYVEGAKQLDQLTVVLIISHYIMSSS